MNKHKLNAEEKELLNSYEAEEWHSVEKLEAKTKTYSEYAKATFKKDERVNIIISAKDLEEIQKIALKEGLPYQTLIGSILHKFVTGHLVEQA